MGNPTPGPWALMRLAAKDGFLVIGTIGDHGPTRHIAEMSWPKDENGALEDARLIATAPELLSQLQYAVKLLGAFPTLNGTAQVQSMRDTIAKARGEVG